MPNIEPIIELLKARLITLHQVSEITTLGKTSLYELIAAGELRPLKLGRKTVFCESEIHDWVKKRLASRPPKTKPLTTEPPNTEDCNQNTAATGVSKVRKKILNKKPQSVGSFSPEGDGDE